VGHSRGDLAGVCIEGRPSVALAPQDLIIHEIDVRKLADALARALSVESGFDQFGREPMTWRLGVYAVTPANRIPVFLTLCAEPVDFHDITQSLLLRSGDPILLLGMTRAVCAPHTEALLRQRASVYAPLEELVEIRAGQIHAFQELKTRLPGAAFVAEKLPPDAIVIERFECEDGIHWAVNGDDKGVFYKRDKSTKAVILEILFNQTGNGWVKHRTFIEKIGWTEKEYFGEAPDPGRMQKQLTEIRKFLGLPVPFDKNQGVQLGPKVVKSSE
jgi:hypothetical protein